MKRTRWIPGLFALLLLFAAVSGYAADSISTLTSGRQGNPIVYAVYDNADDNVDLAAYTSMWRGGIICNKGADAAEEWELPAAIAGRIATIYDAAGFAITLDPNGTNKIYGAGMDGAAGHGITLSAGRGNFVTMFCHTDGEWDIIGWYGTITDAG